MSKRLTYLLVFQTIIALPLFSQSYQDFFRKETIYDDSSKFALFVENTNFVKNNEYFNHFSDGYTLIGYFIKPQIKYRVHEKLNIYAGLHLQKYSGIDYFSNVLPVFSIEYLFTDNLKLFFGGIDGTLDHRLNDFVYADEFYLSQNNENGIQLLFDNKRVWSDTWVNWKQFIFKGSDYPEIMLFGTSNYLNILNSESKHSLSLNLAAVASHVGGQIDISDVSVQTIINTISGLEYSYKLGDGFVKKINLSGKFISFLDFSPTKNLFWQKGSGAFASAGLSGQNYDMKFQTWYGQHYYSKFGNAMFQSITPKYTHYREPERVFVNAHLFYKNDALKIVKFGLGLDLYYDIKASSLDYSYGFYIKTNLGYKIKKGLVQELW
jgi:hypothetical protein